MQNNGQLEHTGDAHWIKAMAEALGNIKRLEEQQMQIIESTKEAMAHEQRYLAREISKSLDNSSWANPETVAATDIRRTHEAMVEYQKDIERHETLRAAYSAAAAIIEAATGEYHYAARDGWYNPEIIKFQTAEARDRYLETDAARRAGWRKATERDLEHIAWADVLPTDLLNA